MCYSQQGSLLVKAESMPDLYDISVVIWQRLNCMMQTENEVLFRQ